MNKKSIFLTLIMLAGTIIQSLGAASAATPPCNLEINASGISLEIKQLPAGQLDGILYFYARGLSTRNATLKRHPMGVISMESDDSSNSNLKTYALRKETEPLREGMICYKESKGFGIVLSLQEIRERAVQDACCMCCCFWAKRTINQRIVKATPDKDGKTLVFLFGDRQVHNSYKPRSK